MKHLGWPLQIRVRPLSRSGGFVALTAVSLLAHGVVLGLPWPKSEPPPAPAPADSSTADVMDVAILPSAALEQPDQTASRQPETTSQKPPVEQRSAAPAEPRSRPVPRPNRPERSPVSPEPTPQSPPAEGKLPPLPEPEAAVDPIADLPIAAGTDTPPADPAPSSPPTLEEQLQDATAYQYDGRKSLKQAEAYQVSTSWVAAGQVLPENVAPLELPYHLGETCLDTPPESGLLAVVLDAAGNFVQGPEVIDSTGYPLLDEQAAAIAVGGDYTFPDRSAPRGYVAEIVVQYPAACL